MICPPPPPFCSQQRYRITCDEPNWRYFTSWSDSPFCPENDIAIAYIHHRWDRIAWRVGVIFQCGISTPGVLSPYNDTTPLVKSAQGYWIISDEPTGDIKRFVQKMVQRVRKFTIEETMLYRVWKSFFNVRQALPQLFHLIMIKLPFCNQQSVIVVHVLNQLDILHYIIKGFIVSLSMRTCCVVCNSHFSTWHKNSRSHFVLTWNDYPYEISPLLIK